MKKYCRDMNATRHKCLNYISHLKRNKDLLKCSANQVNVEILL